MKFLGSVLKRRRNKWICYCTTAIFAICTTFNGRSLNDYAVLVPLLLFSIVETPTNKKRCTNTEYNNCIPLYTLRKTLFDKLVVFGIVQKMFANFDCCKLYIEFPSCDELEDTIETT